MAIEEASGDPFRVGFGNSLDDDRYAYLNLDAAGEGLEAASCGFWFLINASATTDSSVTVRFDRVEWGLAAP